MSGVLDGVKVVDLTQMLSGPFCTMLLADHGADVIKIEPLEGETTRRNGPFLNEDQGIELGGYFQSVNRNKRSIALNLRSPAGKQIVLDLVARSDVIVSNFRIGVMERLGLGYEALAAINPRIVHAMVSGFGSPEFGGSPYCDWPAYDVVAQAMGGIMSITGPDADTPTKIGPGIGDIFPGTLLAFAIVAALRRAEREGVGQKIDVAMYDAVVALCERAMYQYSYSGMIASGEGSKHPFLTPFGMFRASDGWVSIAAQNDNFWNILVEIMERPDLKSAEGFANKEDRTANLQAVNAVVEEWTSRHSKAQMKILLGGRIPFGPVQTSAEIAADPHIAARDMLVQVEEPGTGRSVGIAGTPVKFSATPGGVRRRGPLLGEHSNEILAELGLSQAQAEELKAAGVAA